MPNAFSGALALSISLSAPAGQMTLSLLLSSSPAQNRATVSGINLALLGCCGGGSNDSGSSGDGCGAGFALSSRQAQQSS